MELETQVLPGFADEDLSWFASDTAVCGNTFMHGRGIIICSMLGAGVLLAGTPGYLAKVGPAELRFEPELPPVAETPLQPLVVPKPSESQEVVTPVEKPEDTTVNVNSGTNNASVTQTNLSLQPIVESQPNSPLITPQMFMQFFKNDSSRTNQQIIVAPNVGFSPANPPPSSTATFLQPKK